MKIIDIKKILKLPDTGSKPFVLEHILVPHVLKQHSDDEIVIHHFINHPDKIQLEVERRWKDNDVTKLSFERIILRIG